MIKTTKFDSIKANNQIYFRYGHNCNRTLLLHYGFAIEGNKYEHISTSFNITQSLEEFPDVLEKVKEKRISLLRKFKVYNHRLNIDLIVFFRLNNWTFYGEKSVEELFAVTNLEKEIAILEQIVGFLEESEQIYGDDYDLTDKGLNYHQYFTMVYHIEKLTIIRKQVLLFNLLIEILTKIESGMTIAESSKNLSRSEQTVLQPYLNTIRN